MQLLACSERTPELPRGRRLEGGQTAEQQRQDTRVMREGTDTAKGMSAKQSIVTTSLGTLTLPTSRSLKALCPSR